jgi:hypothetical protein
MIENGKILILEDIQVDETLPKHIKVIENEEQNEGISFSSENGFIRNISNNERTDISLEYLEYQYNTTHSPYVKFKIWLYKKMYGRVFEIKREKNKKKISILELKMFFDNLKSNVSELNISNINEIISKYDSVLSKAKSNKQIALIERLEDYIEILKSELILTTSEFNKFLDERDVILFYEKASKHEKYKTNLGLTYIQNFVKLIPNEITELKMKAEELKVFDNYVILHYDYDGKSVDDTKAEKERKKDPILFGVIKNSKRLYYIGDWIDNYCDLTLDVLIKTIGVNEKQLNQETIIEALS